MSRVDGSFLAVGWDQSLNHAAIVALDCGAGLAEKVAGFYYATDTAGIAAIGKASGHGFRVPLECVDKKRTPDGEEREVLRLLWIRAFAKSILFRLGTLAEGRPVYVALENYATDARQGAHLIGEAGAAVRFACLDRGFALRLHGPESVKMFATDRGNALKREIAARLLADGVDYSRFGKDPEKDPSGDLADAHVLARMARDEVLVRAGELALRDLEPGPRRVFIRTTKAHPLGLLDRPWIFKPGGSL